MTPKEKSRELVDKYFRLTDPYYNIEKAKQSALIAVDEIILNETERHGTLSKIIDYWFEVEQEIEKL